MASPKLRFKEFDGDWTASNLEKTTEYFKGFAFKSESYKEDGIRIIRVSDIDKDSIKYQNEAIFLDETEAQNYLNWVIKKKDIIVTTVGSKPHLIDSAVGRPILVKNNNEGLLNQNLLILRPQNENTDAYFIFSQLLDKKYLTHIETIQRGNANQSNITVKDLQEFEVFEASKEEQTKIASFLSAVDEKINLLTQKHELLSQYKQGMMQKLFSQQIRFKADDGSEFGEWGITSIKDAVSFIKDGTHGTHPDDLSSNLFLLSAKNLQNGKILIDENDRRINQREFDSIYKNYKLKEGDILLSVVGTIGRVAIFKEHYEGYAFQRSVAFIRFKKALPEFVYQLFLAKDFQNELLVRQVVSAQPGIYLGDLSKIEIKLPCLEEQTKIANFLSAIDQKIAGVAQQIAQTKQWKKGLLQQMFV